MIDYENPIIEQHYYTLPKHIQKPAKLVLAGTPLQVKPILLLTPDNAPEIEHRTRMHQKGTRQFTDKTIHRHGFLRQFTDRFEDSSPTLLKTVRRHLFITLLT